MEVYQLCALYPWPPFLFVATSRRHTPSKVSLGQNVPNPEQLPVHMIHLNVGQALLLEREVHRCERGQQRVEVEHERAERHRDERRPEAEGRLDREGEGTDHRERERDGQGREIDHRGARG